MSVCNVYETGGSFFSIRMFKDDIFDALGYVGSSNNKMISGLFFLIMLTKLWGNDEW